MDAKFWHDRWANNEIGFHKSEANPLLVQYFDKLALAKGSRIFVPLCLFVEYNRRTKRFYPETPYLSEPPSF